MRKTTYWKCNADVSAKLIASWDEWQETVKKAIELAKSIGAECIYTASAFGSPYVAGFKFKNPPEKGFKKLKGTRDGYVPRANSELEKAISGMRCGTVSLAIKLIGCEHFVSDDEGLFSVSVGMQSVGKVVYLSTKGTPKKGGKRISDLEFERATKTKGG